MLVSIIIPTYKEADNLRSLVPDIVRSLRSESYEYEIIIVDDDSRDGSEQIIEQFKTNGLPVTMYVREQERGLASAVVLGMSRAHGDVFVVMDGDYSHPPSAIPKLVAPLVASLPLEIVVGSRFVDGANIGAEWPFHRWVNSIVAKLLAKPLIVGSLQDPNSGFFAVRGHVARRAPILRPIGFKILLETIIKCGCTRIDEVPIDFVDRKRGESKLSFLRQLEYLDHLSKLYDFAFPRVSASIKFLITLLLGLGFSFLLAEYLVYFSFVFSIEKAAVYGYIASIFTSGIFYYRYLSYNKGAIESPYPSFEFICISSLEFAAVDQLIGYRPSVLSSLGGCVVYAATTGAIVRFLGRKILKHDIRGPALLGDSMLEFRYEERDLACFICGCRKFRIPFVIPFPWLVKCCGCGLAFAHPQPDDEALKEIYGKGYYNEWGAEEYSDALTAMKQRTFLNLVAPLRKIREIKTMLDVGCGMGEILAAGRDLGWSVRGVDINASAVEKVNQRHPGTASVGEIGKIDFGTHFELVCLLDTIEHLRDPIDALRKLNPLLAEGGLILITTPNALSTRAKALAGSWYHFHRAHLWYFSKDSMADLVQSAGYDLVMLTDCTKYFTLRYVLGILSEKLSNRLSRTLAQHLLRALPRRILRMMLPAVKEGMVAVARKRQGSGAAVNKQLRVDRDAAAA